MIGYLEKIMQRRRTKCIFLLLMLLLCIMGCGREAEDVPKETETEEEFETTEELKMQEADASDMLPSAVRETPLDFPFEESEPPFEKLDGYSLTLAQLKAPDGEYELRLYDEEGKILQRIFCGVLVEPIHFQFDSFSHSTSYGLQKDLEIFSAGSSKGLLFEWDGSRFSESAVEIPQYDEVRKDKMLTVEEGEPYQVKRIYLLDGAEARRLQLNKNTGELEIWDSLTGELLLKGPAVLDETGALVNEKYYDRLLWEEIYDVGAGGEDTTVPTHLAEEREEDGERDVEYESREALLSDFGFLESEPIYQCYDWHHNLLLELYKNESTETFCGIVYDDYYVDTEGKKHSSMYGFTADAIEEKWPGEDAYSKMSSFQADEQDYVKDYEEFTEYTPDESPDHFLSQGLVRTEGGEWLERVMEIDYVYRDDGTLFYRDYHHSTFIFPTRDCYLYSYYDEKGRVLYERGYITHGHLEDYYIYEGDGNMPTYHLELDFNHGYTWPYLVRYYQ